MRQMLCFTGLGVVLGLSSSAATSALPDWVLQDHLDQIQRINRQLALLKDDASLRAYYESFVAPTAHHPAALVLPGDQDAAQIVFRRTRALLDELKRLSPAAAAGFEPALAALQTRLDAGEPLLVLFATKTRLVAPRLPSPVPVLTPSAGANRPSQEVIPDLAADDGTLALNLEAMGARLPAKKAPARAKPADAEPAAPANAKPASGAPAPTMDVLPPELASPVVHTDRHEPSLNPAHPRVALALDILALQRRIALANPLLGDADLLICLRKPGEDHIAAQYKRVVGSPQSGLYRLSGHRRDAPTLTEFIGDATVAAGRLAGQPIAATNRIRAGLLPGAFGWPDLRWDARQIVFSWKEHPDCNHGAEDTRAYFNGAGESQYARERCYHLFAFDLDSRAPDRLRMLTDGSGNDGHPSYVPNGRIVFVSDRRGGVERCGGPSRATLLHSINADGSDPVNLSSHETSEFSPAVSHDGRLVYARWDYVDRGDCIAHHIWTCYPDGRDPRAPHGNYFMGKFRPDAETEFQPIPGDPRLIAIAAAHHVQGHRGSLIVLDLDQPDDDGMSQVRRFTPNIRFPETREPDLGQQAGPLACPWPLNSRFVLAGADAGPVLMDAFGNRTLLARPNVGFPTYEVIPLRPRSRPPAIPHQPHTGVPAVLASRPLATSTPAAASAVRAAAAAPASPAPGVFMLMNVYNSLLSWPTNTQIAALRIVKIYPRANTIWMCWPDVGVASESLVRGVVGTVPVEADGSARFQVPANTLVYFQALDAKGRAVQTMRSGTYLQPGAQVTCLGCHEPKHRAPPPPPTVPLALRRPPTVPDPGPAHSDPVFYPGLIQPILDRSCVSCHDKSRLEGKPAPDLSPRPLQKAGGDPGILYTSRGVPTRWTVSYNSLARYTGRNFGGRPVKYEGRTTPGSFGALNSSLYPLLAGGAHHGVKLADDDLRRLAVWMDLNSNFLGHYLFTEEQSRGILPAPPSTCYPDTSDHPEARIALLDRLPGSVTPTMTLTGRPAAGAPPVNPVRALPGLDAKPVEPDLLLVE